MGSGEGEVPAKAEYTNPLFRADITNAVGQPHQM